MTRDTDPWKDAGGGRRLDGKPKNDQGKGHRPIHELSEEEQLQAAIEASMMDSGNANSGSASSDSFVAELLSIDVKAEPASGARVQIRMPGGAKFIRKFNGDDPVKVIYAFVAVSFWLINSPCSIEIMTICPNQNMHVLCYSNPVMKQRQGNYSH